MAFSCKIKNYYSECSGCYTCLDEEKPPCIEEPEESIYEVDMEEIE